MKKSKFYAIIIALILVHTLALVAAYKMTPRYNEYVAGVEAEKKVSPFIIDGKVYAAELDDSELFADLFIPVLSSRDRSELDEGDLERATVMVSPEPGPAVFERRYNERDIQLLAKLIKAEAGGIKEQDERVAVGLTVLYRISSNNWPDTVAETIFQPHQYTDPADEYTDGTYEAAQEALKIWSGEGGSFDMPERFIYFFGDGKHNYFYCYTSDGGIEFFEFPGRPNPPNVHDLYRKIVLGKS